MQFNLGDGAYAVSCCWDALYMGRTRPSLIDFIFLIVYIYLLIIELKNSLCTTAIYKWSDYYLLFIHAKVYFSNTCCILFKMIVFCFGFFLCFLFEFILAVRELIHVPWCILLHVCYLLDIWSIKINKSSTYYISFLLFIDQGNNINQNYTGNDFQTS